MIKREFITKDGTDVVELTWGEDEVSLRMYDGHGARFYMGCDSWLSNDNAPKTVERYWKRDLAQFEKLREYVDLAIDKVNMMYGEKYDQAVANKEADAIDAD